MLLINFNKKQNKRLWQLCNCGFAPKNTFPFSQSTTARHLCDFLQQKQLQKLVIKALNLEQVFQIPTEKDIIFSHKNYATTIYKTWSNSVTDIKIPVGYWLLLLSFLLLWTDCMCLTFDIRLYVFYFCPQMVWCLLLLMTDYQLRIATISSYVKCTAAHSSMIDQHSQTFPIWLIDTPAMRFSSRQ